MDHVTRTTPLSGMVVVRRLKLDIPASTQNLTTLPLAVPKIFHGVWSSEIGHVTLTMPHSGTVSCPKANTWCSLQPHKIWRLYLQPFQRYFRGCEILQCVTLRWPRPFRGQLVVWRL